MQRPEDDIADRQVVWDAMHVLWLDTETDVFQTDTVAKQCAATAYAFDDLERIYWGEVYPAMRANLQSVAGAWAPLDRHELTAIILKHHRFGKKVRFKSYRRNVFQLWTDLAAQIEKLRAE